jgi:hypothetical protein
MTAKERTLLERLGLSLAALDAALVVMEIPDEDARKRLVATMRQRLNEAHELLLKIQSLLGQIK